MKKKRKSLHAAFNNALMNIPAKSIAFLSLCLCLMIACTQQPQQVPEPPSLPNPTAAFSSGEKPAPLIAKYIDPDSIAPPVVVPLKGQPKMVDAHSNVHPVGTPKVVQIPKDLEIITLGKNGVPLPKTIPAKGKVVLAKHPKPIPAKDFRTKDAAIYNIQYLSDEQGLTYPYISAILEDSRGHIWFGTIRGGGVYRYDGENFFLYTPNEGQLVFEGAWSIIEDKKGNIWIGGWGGLCYYDGQNFVHFTTEEGLGENRAGAVMEDSKGNIWFYSKDLYRYDGENFTIYEKEQAFVNDAKKLNTWFASDAILEIMEDSRGHLWLATAGSGVMRFNGQHVVHLTEEDGLVDNYIRHILEDSEGNIWFGSGGQGIRGKGVSRYTPDLSTPHRVGGTLTNYNKENGLSGNRIQEILEDDAGNIWFATYDGGICRFDGKNFTHFTKEEGMSFDGILCLMEDRNGNIWAGSNGGGVSKFKPNSFRHFTEKQGLGKHWVNRLLEDSQGNIWMGQAYGGVLKYDGQHFINYTTENGLLQDFANGLIEDKEGNIWIKYRDKGISKFDGKIFTHYTTEQGLSSNFFWDIHEDNEGLIWMACGGKSVTRLNPETGQVTHFYGNKKEGIGGGSIFEDKQHDLWFGGQGYLAKYDKDSDQIRFVCQIDTIENEWVELMIEDENGLTKIFGCQVIVSEKTLMELQIFTEEEGTDTLGGDYRFLGKVKVKGKERALKIYDFYDGETEEVRRLKTDTKPEFEKALQLYYDRKFGKAADLFKVILEKYPSDMATHYYMDKSVKYIIDGVDETWSGVELMVSK